MTPCSPATPRRRGAGRPRAASASGRASRSRRRNTGGCRRWTRGKTPEWGRSQPPPVGATLRISFDYTEADTRGARLLLVPGSTAAPASSLSQPGSFPPSRPSQHPLQLPGRGGGEVLVLGEGADPDQVDAVAVPAHADGGIVADPTRLVVPHRGQQLLPLHLAQRHHERAPVLLDEPGGAPAVPRVAVVVIAPTVVQEGEQPADEQVGPRHAPAELDGVGVDTQPVLPPVQRVTVQAKGGLGDPERGQRLRLVRGVVGGCAVVGPDPPHQRGPDDDLALLAAQQQADHVLLADQAGDDARPGLLVVVVHRPARLPGRAERVVVAAGEGTRHLGTQRPGPAAPLAPDVAAV